MYRRLVTLSVAMAMGMVGSATAQQPEAPKVNSWSNSKTENPKTVFAVKPGEKITFSVKAAGAEKYQWLVDGAIQKGADATVFKWTVPNKKGMWKILLKTTNSAREKWTAEEQEMLKGWIERLPKGKQKDRFIRDMVDLNIYPEEARKEWIVATSLVKVKPGLSIQKAIDSLPAEGGIVELAPGTYEVNDTLYPPGTFRYAYKYKDRTYIYRYSILIKRSNVTIYGTRKSIVRHHNNEISCFFIPDLIDTDPKARVENITFRGFTTASAYTKSRRNVLIYAHHAKNLVIESIHDTSHANRLAVVSSAPNKFGIRMARRSENVYYKNNVLEHSSMYGSRCINVYQFNNILLKVARASMGAMGMEECCPNAHIIGNRISAGRAANSCITVFAGGGHLWNVRDNVCKGGQKGIWIGSGISHRLVINNTTTGATQAGIFSRPQGGHRNVLIMNNRIYDNPGHGFWACKYFGTKPRNADDNLINNVIYNNGGDGIRLDGDQWGPLTVTNNIIANNKGYGINRIDEGMKSNILHSYNNVWNNAKGNYNGTSAGKDDISVDPLFADPVNGDFHLKSKAGRWDPKAGKWVKDNVHSPCIDAGDPKTDFAREPAPSGGRVNIGAYANTAEASKSTVR